MNFKFKTHSTLMRSSERAPRFGSHRWSILDDPIQNISEIIMHLILFCYIRTVRILQKSWKYLLQLFLKRNEKSWESLEKLLRKSSKVVWSYGLVWSCLVSSVLVWSGLVWSGLVWSGLVWSGLVRPEPCLFLSVQLDVNEWMNKVVSGVASRPWLCLAGKGHG